MVAAAPDVAAEAAAVQATRARIVLQVAGRWTIRIFRRAVPCSCLRPETRSQAAGRMTTPMPEAVEDAAAEEGLSLA